MLPHCQATLLVSIEKDEGASAPIGRIESKSNPASQLVLEIKAEIQWSFASNPSMDAIPEMEVSSIASLPTPNAQVSTEGVI